MSNSPARDNSNAETIAVRRAALAEALRLGEDVVVNPSGGVEFQNEAEEQGRTAIQVPKTILAKRD